jgi:hypothetical protein
MGSSVSGDTAAIIAGAAAVLGALVGVVGGGAVEAWLERRRQEARARAGARLLRSDLKDASQYLGIAEAGDLWEVQWEVTLPSWGEYRDVLASFLKPPEWKAVDEGVTNFRNAQTRRLISQGEFDERRQVIVLRPYIKDNMRKWIDQAGAAYNALGSLAEGEPFEGDFGGIAVARRFNPATERPEDVEEELRAEAEKLQAEETPEPQSDPSSRQGATEPRKRRPSGRSGKRRRGKGHR